ncbi:hypothetical protein HBI42_219600 [Parastagonospora nodorum]|nr:hypothetical protein HBI47_219840 [Parastagonospora nodorum]KAH6201731.1 hypothetical protein HBI43_217150 [Parastagonospora nodorum]KAH6243421.1 hypothetical protein HBI42_219600 [Parastagonospora nodorum]
MQNHVGNKFYTPKGWFPGMPCLSLKQRLEARRAVGRVDKEAAGTATVDVSQPTSPKGMLKSDNVSEVGMHTPSVREGAESQPKTPKSILKSNKVLEDRMRTLDVGGGTEPKRVKWDERLVQIKWT